MGFEIVECGMLAGGLNVVNTHETGTHGTVKALKLASNGGGPGVTQEVGTCPRIIQQPTPPFGLYFAG
jgi:hypothetical protein